MNTFIPVPVPIKKERGAYRAVLQKFGNIDVSDNVVICDLPNERITVPSSARRKNNRSKKNVAKRYFDDKAVALLASHNTSDRAFFKSKDDLLSVQSRHFFVSDSVDCVEILNPGEINELHSLSSAIPLPPKVAVGHLVFNLRRELYLRSLARTSCVILASRGHHSHLRSMDISVCLADRVVSVSCHLSRFFVTEHSHYCRFANDYCRFDGVRFEGPFLSCDADDRDALFEWWRLSRYKS